MLVGLIDAVFGRVLIGLSEFRDHHLFYLVPALPLAGLLIVYLYQKFAGKAAQGMGLIFKVGHNEEDQVPLRLIPLVTVTTWLTHLFGGSAGREGVAVQLGATVSHAFSRYFKLPNASRIFLIMGMAAGFGGLFQTPIAATFFALEVLTLGQLSLPILVPTLIASFMASTTSHLLGLEKFSHFVSESLTIDLETFMKLALLGLAFGIAGNLFAYLLSLAKKKVASLLPNPYYPCSLRKCRLNLSSFDFVEGTLYRSWNEFDCFKCWWWDHLSIGLALEIALDRLYPISWFPRRRSNPFVCYRSQSWCCSSTSFRTSNSTCSRSRLSICLLVAVPIPF